MPPSISLGAQSISVRGGVNTHCAVDHSFQNTRYFPRTPMTTPCNHGVIQAVVLSTELNRSDIEWRSGATNWIATRGLASVVISILSAIVLSACYFEALDLPHEAPLSLCHGFELMEVC